MQRSAEFRLVTRPQVWFIGRMITAAILLLCTLWLLLCARFYVVISPENVGQRRMIAIGGGIGAGLLYVLGSMLAPLFKEPPPETTRPIETIEDVRVISR